jgi:ABC-type cobalamin transport system ATPase subunit
MEREALIVAIAIRLAPSPGSPLGSVARYLLVDDRDGRVLAELASAHQAVRLLGLLVCNPHADPQVSVVRLDHQQGSLIDVTSMVSMRPLPPLMARRGQDQDIS